MAADLAPPSPDVEGRRAAVQAAMDLWERLQPRLEPRPVRAGAIAPEGALVELPAGKVANRAAGDFAVATAGRRGGLRAPTGLRLGAALLGALLALFSVWTPVLAAEAVAPVHGYEVVRVLPHDRDAFTQGLLVHAGEFYESTGRYQRSELRRVAIDSGDVLERFAVPPQYFAEGLALLGDRLHQLTWRAGEMLVYGRDGLQPSKRVRYAGEGWGLTTDGTDLLMSDGSHVLTWISGDLSRRDRPVEVRDGDRAVTRLNELEWLPRQGAAPARVLANVWTTQRVAIIDPVSGKVTGWIDFSGLRAKGTAPVKRDEDVLNGIAYDADARRLYVTGKLWPHVFEVRSPALTPYLTNKKQ